MYHLCFFLLAKLEYKILGKSLEIALNRLVKHFGGHTINSGQVSINHHPLAPDDEDRAFYLFYRNNVIFPHYFTSRR